MQGVHHRPGDVGVAGGVGSGGAEGDLSAARGSALDGQEGLGDVGPTGVPLDPRRTNHVLSLEDQRGFRLQAVVNLCGPWVEVVHQVEHTDAHPGGVDADVLDIESLGQQLDLVGLVGERLASPAMLLQDPELAALLRRRRHHHTGRVVSGATGVVPQPHRGIAKRSVFVGFVVLP